MRNFAAVKSVLLCAAAFAVSGCGLFVPVDPPDLAHNLAAMTNEGLERTFSHETLHLPEEKKRRKIGLALSGGGTKAGMYAHGVLHGLNQSGLLDHVDAISTASGGGYAAYWYFTKRLEAQRQGFDYRAIFQDCIPVWLTRNDSTAEQELLRAMDDAKRAALKAKISTCNNSNHYFTGEGNEDPWRWQAHIVRWPSVFAEHIVIPTGEKQTGPYGNIRTYTIRTLFEWFPAFFGYEATVVREYREGLQRTWGLNPKPREMNRNAEGETEFEREQSRWVYTNAVKPFDRNGSPVGVDPGAEQWSDFQALYRDQGAANLPLWILNATQGQKRGTPNAYNLYELTPFGYGSARHGYKVGLPPLKSGTLSEGLQASAAFFDAQGVEDGFQRALLGGVANVLGGLAWGVNMPDTTKEGAPYTAHLSDGGGAENTGALSLIRRGMDDVIIADSAQDASGTMKDMCVLKALLKKEHLTLSFEALENFEQVCTKPENGNDLAYNVSEWASPVVVGEVTWPQVAGAASPRKVKVYLLKPGWNELQVREIYNKGKPECGFGDNEFNCWLVVYFGHDNNTRVAENDYMKFPQHTTVGATADSSTYRVWAYRELGRMQAVNLRFAPGNNPGEGRVVNVGQQCKQVSIISDGKTVRPNKMPWENGRVASPKVCITEF